MVGSGAQSDDAAAMRSTVCIAVPDGASTFWSWWSSITSAVSNHGAASSAKRTMSTAPMAKLGAITAFADDASKRAAEVVDVGGREAGGADDRVHAVVGAPRDVLAGGVEHGEVDRDLGAGVGQRTGMAGHLQAGVDAVLAQVEPGVHRVDGGDELELGIGEHGAAHGGAHASGRTEHTDSDHRTSGL